METQALELAPAPAATPVGPVTPESILLRAIESNMSVENMERITALFAQMKKESAKEAYFRALAEFQGECPTIEKKKAVMNRDGRTVRYKYAPLEDIVAQVGPLLRKHGFSYDVDTKVEAGFFVAICNTHHIMGHSETKEYRVAIDQSASMNVTQQFGSAGTYAKRYAFTNAFGIMTGDEDTDANGNDDAPPAKKPEVKPNGNGNRSKPIGERVEALKKFLGAKAEWAVGYLRIYDVNGNDFAPALMPDGTLESLTVAKLDYISTHHKEFIERLDAFIAVESKPDPAVQPDAPPDIPERTPISKQKDCALCKSVGTVLITGEFESCNNCGYRNYCKYCAHYDLVWSRDDRNQQFWRCKKCGRGEHALPQEVKPIEQHLAKATQNLPESSDWWRTFEIPFGKEKGKTLAAADKKWLFGIWANYKVETHKDGKPRKKEWIEADRKFRAALDWAGQHYEFAKND